MAKTDNALLAVLSLCADPLGEFAQAPVLNDAWEQAFDEDLIHVNLDNDEGEDVYLTADGASALAEILGIDILLSTD